MLREITKSKNKSDMVTEALVALLVVLISTLLLRLLWNRSLVKHITVFKKIDSFLDAFLLSIALAVIRGC
jgi:hypothetical protein